MRRIAFWLRNLADLVDPRISPSPENVMVVRIEADTSQFMEALGRVAKALDDLNPQLEKLQQAGVAFHMEEPRKEGA